MNGGGILVRITEVEKNSLAAKNGICVDDTLISVNGHEIRDVVDYRDYLTVAGVILEDEREGIRFDVVITLEE